MRVTLVTMPWAPVDVPSLALGILTTKVRDDVPGTLTRTMNANLDYADWAGEKVGLDGAEYAFFAEESYFSGCGDWVFSSALYRDREWRNAEFEEIIAPGLPASRRALARRLHELAPDAIEHLVARILESGPDVVGFTTTFQQNVASLAAAQRIKELTPDVVTVFGGANCDGPQGTALHRNFAFVDFVVRGEGETAFPELLAALNSARPRPAHADRPVAARRPWRGIEGLCHRADDGGSVANPMAAHPLPPARIPTPDFADYFERFPVSIARSWGQPKLAVEGSRGCWWGEKHHCTFCGLNGSFMTFRGKPPGRFLEELVDLVGRHRVLDVIVVDNILEMDYLRSFLPALAEAGYDLRVHYEIKANMRRPQLRALFDAGVVLVQPGIESFSTRILKLMDKGVTGCQNIRALRDAETVGLAVSWNYLYGFPGEEPGDYRSIIDQIPALHHLPPPTGCSRIGIERFSPYHERPELGFTDPRPADHYSAIYDLPEPELEDLAYLFSVTARGIDESTSGVLAAALAGWGRAHNESRLTHCDLGDEIVLVNGRAGFDWEVERLTDPLETATFRLLDQPRSEKALARRLREETGGDVAEGRVSALLARWRARGIVFAEGGHVIQLAPEANNNELTRVGHLRLRSRG